MRAGMIDRRVTLERKTYGAAGTYGEPTFTWGVVDTVSADVRYAEGGEAPGDESEQAGRVVGLVQATFSLRYRNDLMRYGSDMRIVYDGRKYNVRTVVPVGRRDRLNVRAEAEHV